MDLQITRAIPPHKSALTPIRTGQDATLMQKAQELEASFLAEMLGHAGLDMPSESFGGGIGEDQFASLLRGEQAKAMVQKGGIGLAEHLFRALSQRAENAK
jgi:Rod binding domain-containing protein